MKSNNIKRYIVLIMIVLLVLLLGMLSYILIILTENVDTNTELNVSVPTNKIEKTIKDVINEYDAKYISEKDEYIYISFSKDLYDENGNSNEQYFNSFVEEINELVKKTEYYLCDDEKDIKIHVLKHDESYSFTINEFEDYYSQIDGKIYAEVTKSKIKESTEFYYNNFLLSKLKMRTMYFSAIEKDLGEGYQLENGYVSYLNDTVRLRLIPNKCVRNIIFSNQYEENITNKVNMQTSLEEILEYYPDNCFGSLKDEYLGYITDNYYYFFYDDEVSIYGYSYSEDDTFESILEEYLNTKDLEKFVNRIETSYKVYDFLEFDKENQNAHIVCSSRGIEINIKNNDPTGIILYSNYCFSEKTKDYVKKGLISLSSEDLVHKIELKRRVAN